MANSADHDEQTVNARGHGHGHAAGIRGLLGSIFRPHSHDAADSVDSALEASAAGVRAVKISLLALLVTGLTQAVIVVFADSVALLADTIHNFSDAMTAIPLWSRSDWAAVADPALYLRLRAGRRPRRHPHRRDDRLVRGRVRLRVDPPPVSSAAGHQHRRPDRGRSHRICRERVGRDLPHPSLAPDRLSGAGRRWPARRTDGFTSLAVVLGPLGALAGFPLADPSSVS